MKLRLNSFLLALLLVAAVAASLSADPGGQAGRLGDRASKEQVAEVYRYLMGQFLRQNETAALEALQQLRQSLEQHQRAISRARDALARFNRKTGRDKRGMMMTDQLARFEQTLRYQYLLQMLWLDPENDPGRVEDDSFLTVPEHKEPFSGDDDK